MRDISRRRTSINWVRRAPTPPPLRARVMCALLQGRARGERDGGGEAARGGGHLRHCGGTADARRPTHRPSTRASRGHKQIRRAVSHVWQTVSLTSAVHGYAVGYTATQRVRGYTATRLHGYMATAHGHTVYASTQSVVQECGHASNVANCLHNVTAHYPHQFWSRTRGLLCFQQVLKNRT